MAKKKKGPGKGGPLAKKPVGLLAPGHGNGGGGPVSAAPLFRSCSHRGEPVRVGPHKIGAGGTRHLRAEDFLGIDVLIPLLDGSLPLAFGQRYSILAAPLRDFGGVPSGWRSFLEGAVIPLLESGASVLTFCMGSHGRTGVFLASLVALLEDPAETPDPIAAVRARHCREAVETRAQAEAVFALRGEPLPLQYEREFAPRPAPQPLGGMSGTSRWDRGEGRVPTGDWRDHLGR